MYYGNLLNLDKLKNDHSNANFKWDAKENQKETNVFQILRYLKITMKVCYVIIKDKKERETNMK